MGGLKKNIAALWCVCFLTFALLPVSMTIGSPWTSMLSHSRHAKRIHRAKPTPSPALKPPQPARPVVAGDILPEENKEFGNPLQSASAARSPAASSLQGPAVSLAFRLAFAGKVSTRLFESVLNL